MPRARSGEYRKSLDAAATYVTRAPRHPYAMILRANALYRLGSATRAVDGAAGCELIRQSMGLYGELIALGKPMPSEWREEYPLAEAGARRCGK